MGMPPLMALSLSLSLRTHQFDQNRLFYAPRLTVLYHTPSMST